RGGRRGAVAGEVRGYVHGGVSRPVLGGRPWVQTRSRRGTHRGARGTGPATVAPLTPGGRDERLLADTRSRLRRAPRALNNRRRRGPAGARGRACCSWGARGSRAHRASAPRGRTTPVPPPGRVGRPHASRHADG